MQQIGFELTTLTTRVQHLTIEPLLIMIIWIFKLISIPKLFASGFNGKQTPTFYLLELELILGQTPSSDIEIFQFPFKQKQ